MPDAQSRFLQKLLNEKGDLPEDQPPYTSERQLAAQAFSFHVEKRDGRHSEAFPWAHYAGCLWKDEGSHERLVILFGSRAVEIEGHNLKVLENEVRSGQLNGVREMVTAQAAAKTANADADPVIREVRMYPDFEEILKEIKGEQRSETRFTERLER